MTRRWLLATAVLVAAAAPLVVITLRLTATGHPQAARLFGPLPVGYRYAELEADAAEATSSLFRERTGASDVAFRLVGTPEDLAPVGVTVAAFTLPVTPDPLHLAAQLEKDVTLVEPMRKELAGQPVLVH